mmetsp:Transcript_23121/g.68130  ORF Transcript_23121/g.68130 Transcript_23121/m.68130 type:complete len:236 (-) Transcript_23121:246-953(-)
MARGRCRKLPALRLEWGNQWVPMRAALPSQLRDAQERADLVDDDPPGRRGEDVVVTHHVGFELRAWDFRCKLLALRKRHDLVPAPVDNESRDRHVLRPGAVVEFVAKNEGEAREGRSHQGKERRRHVHEGGEGREEDHPGANASSCEVERYAAANGLTEDDKTTGINSKTLRGLGDEVFHNGVCGGHARLLGGPAVCDTVPRILDCDETQAVLCVQLASDVGTHAADLVAITVEE